MTTIEHIQQILEVTMDDTWGPVSQEALIAANEEQKKEIQTLLAVPADGDWGPVSQSALNRARAGTGFRDTHFSSFADPADLKGFEKCKATGKSDVECFAVGDNGIGEFGQVTAQEDVPMVAIHRAEMVARWGSEHGAAHRMVELLCGDMATPIPARCEDRISEKGRVDLNPAAAKLLGLTPPFVVPGKWRWAS